MPLMAMSKSILSPGFITPRSTPGASNVIVIAGHLTAAIGPCAIVIVFAETSTDSTVPVAEAVIAFAGVAAVSEAGPGLLGVFAVPGLVRAHPARTAIVNIKLATFMVFSLAGFG
jgi:hypothetical protein